MTFASRVAERILRLPPAATRDVRIQRGLPVPMDDGVELLADLYTPVRVPNAPLVLVRSPYGRRGWLEQGVAMPFAERGYRVLVQAVRGTEKSGGTFDPFGDERRDGLATLDWIEKQSWSHGPVLTFGPSYLGYAQWAMAADAGDRIAAMAPFATASQFRDQTYLGDSFTLRGCLSWSTLMVGQKRNLFLAQLEDVLGTSRLERAYLHLPIGESDRRATGTTVDWFQKWLAHGDPGDPYWLPERDHRARVGESAAEVSMVGGWHDLFLLSQLEDHARLRAAGRRPRLTIGPWTHTAVPMFGAALRDALIVFRAAVTGDGSALRGDPVKLFVQGAEEWRTYPEWPPPAEVTPFHLHAGGLLSRDAPGPGEPSRFTYDPADPTPGTGGPLLGAGAGPKDQSAVEARPDVLLFTTEPLDRDLEVIGPVSARVHLRSDSEHTDVLVRVCDVDENGLSVNVCDGLQRVVPGRFPSGEVEVTLWPTAHRFRAGHRIRVHVASGSHPRFARNPGTGDPLGTATRLLPQNQEILHDPAHPSALLLPLVPV
ncbi:CocE/NonD family hydrolase [Actinocorallia longicatena]|uniref:CocE/NonD family hydrolase n=1 Tax=Actinocorallia longicatena TaxID=111803 RepID=A0ABP6QBC4_9ACTN